MAAQSRRVEAAQSRKFEVNTNAVYPKANTNKSNNNTPQALYNQALEYLQGSNMRGQQLRSALPELHKLIQDIFNNRQSMFDMDKSLPDPFLQKADETVTPDYFVEWYNSINPNMQSMSEIKDKLTIPEFATVLAQIARDCIIMILTGYKNLGDEFRILRNFTNKISHEEKKLKQISNDLTLRKKISSNRKRKNNFTQQNDYLTYKKNKLQTYKNVYETINRSNSVKQNNNTFRKTKERLRKALDDKSTAAFVQLLYDINECIKSRYLYGQAIKIFITFIHRISDRLEDRINNKYNGEFKEINLEEYFRNPHIIYPTYQSISFQTVVLLTTAPICNFRMINRKRKIHDEFGNAKFDFWHDVIFHGEMTHKYKIKQRYEQDFTYDIIALKQHIKSRQELNRLLFDYYFCKELCKNIAEHYEGDGSYDSLNKQQKQLVIAIILFELLHEKSNFFRFMSKLIISDTESDLYKTYLEEMITKYNDPNLLKKYHFLQKLNWQNTIDTFINIYKSILPNLKFFQDY